MPEVTIRVAVELSHSSWIVAGRLPDVEKSWLHRLEGGDTAALLTLIDDLRSREASYPTFPLDEKIYYSKSKHCGAQSDLGTTRAKVCKALSEMRTGRKSMD
jgi:hypothetical protein